MTTTLKVAIYAAILAAFLGAGALYGHLRYTAGRNDLLAEQAVASSKATEKAQARAVTGDASAAKAVDVGQQKQADTKATTQTVVQTVVRYIHDSPAPAVCVMRTDDPVLRELTAAAARATSAADSLRRADASGDAGAAAR